MKKIIKLLLYLLLILLSSTVYIWLPALMLCLFVGVVFYAINRKDRDNKSKNAKPEKDKKPVDKGASNAKK